MKLTRTCSRAAIAALALAGCGSAAKTTTVVTTKTVTAPPEKSTLKLQSQLQATPLGESATSPPGSQMIFTGMLFVPKGARAIGRSQGSCTRTAPGKGEVYQCLLAFVFPNGVIYGESVASFEGPADGVVTGGTQHYADVRGTFRYQATGNPRVNLTFTLLS
jgi:hypothetical protein